MSQCRLESSIFSYYASPSVFIMPAYAHMLLAPIMLRIMPAKTLYPVVCTLWAGPPYFSPAPIIKAALRVLPEDLLSSGKRNSE